MAFTILKVQISDPRYPDLLRHIPNPPKEIYYRGTLPNNNDVLVAIVGTRKVTHEGRIISNTISEALANHGITVVSGLAFGVDGAAHEGALRGNGKTIAVLGNGLNKIYPHAHTRLGEKIIEKSGAIISEYPEDTPAYPKNFLERNRIVSGLSRGIIVIEAPMRSGSLVTAKCALEQGREVFVLPGPVNHPNYEGSHYLLRNGARLIRSAQDVLEDLGLEVGSKIIKLDFDEGKKRDDLDKEAREILKAVKKSRDGISIDEIGEITNVPPNIAAQKLSFLVLKNILEERGGIFILKV